MKGDACMVREAARGGGARWRAALLGAVLVAGAAVVVAAVFAARALSEVGELRGEVDRLREEVHRLQGAVAGMRAELPVNQAKTTILSSAEQAYDDIVDEDSYDDYYNDYYPNLEDGQFSQETTLVPSRKKRSIIRYPQEGTSNEEYPDNKKRNLTFRKHHETTTSTYTYPSYTDSEEAQSPQPRLLHSRKFMVRNEQEHPDVEFVGHTRHRQRRLELDEPNFRTGRMRPLPVAQFVGDTSRFVFGQHENFNGNGHLKHPQRRFVDWAETRWFRALGMDQHFSMNDGILTIKDAGLYFIYAQIYYLDEHDINGFRVYKNENETVLQCTTMTHTMHRVWKGNTCFTAGVEYLEEDEKISVGDLSESRYSLFEPGKSFFGVIKIGDVKIK